MILKLISVELGWLVVERSEPPERPEAGGSLTLDHQPPVASKFLFLPHSQRLQMLHQMPRCNMQRFTEWYRRFDLLLDPRHAAAKVSRPPGRVTSNAPTTTTRRSPSASANLLA